MRLVLASLVGTVLLACAGCSHSEMDVVGSYAVTYLPVPKAVLTKEEKGMIAFENAPDGGGLVLKADHTYTLDIGPGGLEGDWHVEGSTVILEAGDLSTKHFNLSEPMTLGVSSDRKLLVIANGQDSSILTIFKRVEHSSQATGRGQKQS